jgi:transposase
MSDAEWQVIEPVLPTPGWMAGKGGRPARWCRRDIVDAIRYLVKEGIQWRAMPCDFPPFQPVYDVLDQWQENGATQAMHDELRGQCRVAAGRKPEPTAAIIDSQSVKAAETVGKASRGYDAGKKIAGRKRHIAVDTIGLLLAVLVTAAGVQDRTGRSRCCGTCAGRSAPSGSPGPMPRMPGSWWPGRRPRSSWNSRS